MEDKRKVNINSILNKIDFLFSEEIQKSELNEGDICLDFIRQIDNIIYVKRAINRRDKVTLKRIAESKLKQYLSSHTDNTLELFIETEIENVKKYQTYFPNYKSNSKEKTIYYDLETWIEVIESLKVGRENSIIFKSKEIAEVIEKNLPPLMANNFDEILTKLNSFTSNNERIIFLNRTVKQYGIEEAIKLWDLDCEDVCRQLKTKIGWSGLFDTMLGVFDINSVDESLKVLYQFGQTHYKDYIKLCEILESLKNNTKSTQIELQNPPPPLDESISIVQTQNQFNNVPIDLVTKYFMQLAETPNEYLTKEEVNKFIDKAFCNNIGQIKLDIKISRGEPKLVWKLFSNFFRDCAENYQYETSIQGKKEKYVRLITDNFTNWEYQKVFDNFARGNAKYWKRLKDFKT